MTENHLHNFPCSHSPDRGFRFQEELFRMRSLSTTSTDLPISSEVRVHVSRPIKHDLKSLVSTLSEFGEIQHIDVSRMQFDSTVSLSYFDVRASVVARSSLSQGYCAGLSIPSRSRSDSCVSSLFCTTLESRSVEVVGFDNTGGLECQELMLSVFGRFGEVESINLSSNGGFTLVFFDTRSVLAVQSALLPEQDMIRTSFSERVVVTDDQLLHLLLIGNKFSDETDVSPPQLIRSPPSRDFDRAKSASNEFAILLRDIEKGRDKRTTVMIRNIPKTFSQTFFMSILEGRFHNGSFDFVYLPMDLMNGVNVGYAFINFQDPHSIIPFFNFFNNKTWHLILQTLEIPGARAFEPDISKRTCKVTYARIQGLDQLGEHFRSSSIMSQPDSIRPYFFTDSE